jgi:hypothetical protein
VNNRDLQTSEIADISYCVLGNEVIMRKYFMSSLRWSSRIMLLTALLAAMFTTISVIFLSNSSILLGMGIVMFFVIIGIASDTIGLSAAASKEIPFRAMASKKIRGAKEAMKICRRAEIFSSFFNDVIGDICGIVSGTATAAVVLQLAILGGHHENSIYYSVIAIIFTSIVAGITVGGKAICKSLAIRGSTHIILFLGKVIYFIENKLRIRILDRIKQ